ncbi:hypothetical protein [Halospeciosus flavus]|uniref:hypothetical protein n=1 Tax=Halospeciosus flavus TaxID=3032283 RepID=UPI00361AD2AD
MTAVIDFAVKEEENVLAFSGGGIISECPVVGALGGWLTILRSHMLTIHPFVKVQLEGVLVIEGDEESALIHTPNQTGELQNKPLKIT